MLHRRKEKNMNSGYQLFDVSDEDLCGDALIRGVENLLEQAARAVNAVPDEDDSEEERE